MYVSKWGQVRLPHTTCMTPTLSSHLDPVDERVHQRFVHQPGGGLQLQVGRSVTAMAAMLLSS